MSGYFEPDYRYSFYQSPIHMDPCYPLEPPCYVPPPPRKALPEFLKELPWFLVSVQILLLVAMLLGFFAFMLGRPDAATAKRLSTTTEVPVVDDYDEFNNLGMTFRKLPRFPMTQKTTTELILEPIEMERLTDPLPPTPSNPPPVEVSSEEPEDDDIIFTKAAIYTDHPACSEIGRSILLRGGNAVDAAVSSLLCLSAAHPHLGGLGGGLVATISHQGTCTVLNARETAPAASDASYFEKHLDETVVGSKAIATPGFLHGLYRMFERFSSRVLDWKQLAGPTIELCRIGVQVSAELAADIEEHRSLILNDNKMRALFTNTTTRQLLVEGDIMRCPSLAATLSDMAEYEDVADYFYNGGTGFSMANEMADSGGLLSSSDLEDYESEFSAGLLSSLPDGSLLCGPQPPSMYAAVQLAVRTHAYSNASLEQVIPLSFRSGDSLGDPVFSPSSQHISMTTHEAVQRMIERIQQGERAAKIEPAEEGSSTVLVVDEHGMAVAMTSSIGDKFGSRQLSNLGFFLNNAISAFDYPTSKTADRKEKKPNALQAGKCPQTRSSSVIGLRNGEVSFLTGGSDFSSLVRSLSSIVTSSVPDDVGRSPVLRVEPDAVRLEFASQQLIAGY